MRKWIYGAAAVIWLLQAPMGAVTAYGAETTVEYSQLRELVQSGNLSLKQTLADNADSVADYQEMYSILKREQHNMEDEAEESEGSDAELQALYSSNASMLESSAKRIYSQLESLTGKKTTKTLEKSTDSYTMTAQTLMNSYNQMVQNLAASEKRTEASQASYEETQRKYSIGAATSEELLSAQNSLTQARNSLASIQEQYRQQRQELLTFLGLNDEENVTIGAIPEPDLAAIEAIDFESDKQKAIGNSSSVQQARHSSANSTAAFDRRFKEVAEAEGTAEAEILATYQQLQTEKLEYQAALAGYESSLLTYQSLQRRKAAGMVNQTEYLQGEAAYLEKKAAKETASMNLVQAYETYLWQVKGTA